jgi:[acyl-carrier-protein] S-malonyltransferase
MKLAVLCSGQGAQGPGMFALTERAQAAQRIFAAAARVLHGIDPRALVGSLSREDLHANLQGQVLCCTQALAAWSSLALPDDLEVLIAGYSVGELAAWGCAGLLEPEAVFDLVTARAYLMDREAGDRTGLVAVLGLKLAKVARIAAAHGAFVAIIIADDSCVVGGERTVLAQVCNEAQQAGALRACVLPVALASHTPLLKQASEDFARRLEGVRCAPVAVQRRLLSGIDGDFVTDGPMGLRKLAAQISSPIDWAACLTACREAGVDTVLELGPGRTLAHNARKALPDARVRSFDEFHALTGVRGWLTERLA